MVSQVCGSGLSGYGDGSDRKALRRIGTPAEWITPDQSERVVSSRSEQRHVVRIADLNGLYSVGSLDRSFSRSVLKFDANQIAWSNSFEFTEPSVAMAG